MTDLRTAAQQALVWIHYTRRAQGIDEPAEERALRAALAEPVDPDPWGAGYEAGYEAGVARGPAQPVREPVQEPLPTSDEAEAQVLARLSKTPAEAYERGYMDGHSRGVEAERERCARICDNIDVMSRDPMVCRGSAQECVEAIRETLAEPVAWLSTDCIGERYLCFTKPQDTDPVQPLYTAPPQPAQPVQESSDGLERIFGKTR